MAYHIKVEEGVLTFTIDRPEIRNAINDEVTEGLELLARQVKEDESIRLVIITGAGEQAFCSGGDLSVFHALRTEEQAYPMLKRVGDALYGIKTLPVPTIALINGTAVGGGCELATACDHRLVWTHAKGGFIQGRLAMTSGWGGGTYLFEAIQHSQAMKMVTEAVPYTADQLHAMGWATEIIESEADIERFLVQMKKTLPEVHRAYKAMAIRKWEQAGLKARVDEEIRANAYLWAQDAHHEAVDRFLSKGKK